MFYVILIVSLLVCGRFDIFQTSIYFVCTVYIRKGIPKVQSKMDNPEKLATQGTEDEEKNNTTQHVLETTMRKQTQIA